MPCTPSTCNTSCTPSMCNTSCMPSTLLCWNNLVREANSRAHWPLRNTGWSIHCMRKFQIQKIQLWMAVQKYTTLSTTAETSESIQLTIIIMIATGIGHHRSEFEQLLRSGGCSKEKPTKAFLSIKTFFAQYGNFVIVAMFYIQNKECCFHTVESIRWHLQANGPCLLHRRV